MYNWGRGKALLTCPNIPSASNCKIPVSSDTLDMSCGGKWWRPCEHRVTSGHVSSLGRVRSSLPTKKDCDHVRYSINWIALHQTVAVCKALNGYNLSQMENLSLRSFYLKNWKDKDPRVRPVHFWGIRSHHSQKIPHCVWSRQELNVRRKDVVRIGRLWI